MLSKSAKGSIMNKSNPSSEDDPWMVSRGPDTPMGSQKKLNLGSQLSSNSSGAHSLKCKKKSSKILVNKSASRVIGAPDPILE